MGQNRELISKNERLQKALAVTGEALEETTEGAEALAEENEELTAQVVQLETERKDAAEDAQEIVAANVGVEADALPETSEDANDHLAQYTKLMEEGKSGEAVAYFREHKKAITGA